MFQRSICAWLSRCAPWYRPFRLPRPTVLAVAKRRKYGCGREHAVLVEQRELAVALEDALDDEHHVGPAGVVFVEDQRHRPLQRPGHDAFLELGDLLAVAQHHGVLADQVEPADVAVEVDAHAGPVQARRHLLDVRGLAGAVQALHHDAPVAHEAGQDGQRDVGVEAVDRVDLGHVLVALAEGRHLQVGVDAEDLAHARAAGRVAEWSVSARVIVGASRAAVRPASRARRRLGSMRPSACGGALQRGQQLQRLVERQAHHRRLHGHAQVGAAALGPGTSTATHSRPGRNSSSSSA